MTIIAICGLISSGKDTAAKHLVNEHGFARLSFAGTLKDAISSIFSWDRDLLEGLTAEARLWRESVDSWWAERLNVPNLTPRWVMQHLGTDVLRQHFHDDIWIASLESRLRKMQQDVVISDCRFPNEIKSLRSAGANIIRVVRGVDPDWFETATAQNRGLAHPQTMRDWFPEIHISEWAWAGTRFDHVIENDKDLQHLRDQVNSLVRDLKVATRS